MGLKDRLGLGLPKVSRAGWVECFFLESKPSAAAFSPVVSARYLYRPGPALGDSTCRNQGLNLAAFIRPAKKCPKCLPTVLCAGVAEVTGRCYP